MSSGFESVFLPINIEETIIKKEPIEDLQAESEANAVIHINDKNLETNGNTNFSIKVELNDDDPLSLVTTCYQENQPSVLMECDKYESGSSSESDTWIKPKKKKKNIIRPKFRDVDKVPIPYLAPNLLSELVKSKLKKGKARRKLTELLLTQYEANMGDYPDNGTDHSLYIDAIFKKYKNTFKKACNTSVDIDARHKLSRIFTGTKNNQRKTNNRLRLNQCLDYPNAVNCANDLVIKEEEKNVKSHPLVNTTCSQNQSLGQTGLVCTASSGVVMGYTQTVEGNISRPDLNQNQSQMESKANPEYNGSSSDWHNSDNDESDPLSESDTIENTKNKKILPKFHFVDRVPIPNFSADFLSEVEKDHGLKRGKVRTKLGSLLLRQFEANMGDHPSNIADHSIYINAIIKKYKKTFKKAYDTKKTSVARRKLSRMFSRTKNYQKTLQQADISGNCEQIEENFDFEQDESSDFLTKFEGEKNDETALVTESFKQKLSDTNQSSVLIGSASIPTMNVYPIIVNCGPTPNCKGCTSAWEAINKFNSDIFKKKHGKIDKYSETISYNENFTKEKDNLNKLIVNKDVENEQLKKKIAELELLLRNKDTQMETMKLTVNKCYKLKEWLNAQLPSVEKPSSSHDNKIVTIPNVNTSINNKTTESNVSNPPPVNKVFLLIKDVSAIKNNSSNMTVPVQDKEEPSTSSNITKPSTSSINIKPCRKRKEDTTKVPAKKRKI